MQAVYTQVSGSNTVEDICCLKDHESCITRKTHKARVTTTQRRLYISRSINVITIFISEVLSKVKPSEISQHLCVIASMNSLAGTLPSAIHLFEIAVKFQTLRDRKCKVRLKSLRKAISSTLL